MTNNYRTTDISIHLHSDTVVGEINTEKPIIYGSSAKGVVREYIRKQIEYEEVKQETENELFGNDDKRGTLIVTDFSPSKKTKLKSIPIIHPNKNNLEYIYAFPAGTVLSGSMYFTKDTTLSSFFTIKCGLNLINRIGARTSKGFGNCSFNIDKFETMKYDLNILSNEMVQWIKANGILPRLERLEIEILNYFNQNFDKLAELNSFDFEYLIKELFAQERLDVTWTQKTRDGGYDLLILHPENLRQPLIVECKRFNKLRKVGISLVRELLGVVEDKTGVEGLLITTSDFTKDALEFTNRNKQRISVRNFQDLKLMLDECQRKNYNR